MFGRVYDESYLHRVRLVFKTGLPVVVTVLYVCMLTGGHRIFMYTFMAVLLGQGKTSRLINMLLGFS